MNKKTAIIITGDEKGGVKAIRATKKELGEFNQEQKETQKSTAGLKSKMGGLMMKLGAAGVVIGGVTAAVGGLGASLRINAIREIGYLTDALDVNARVMTEWGYATETVGFSNEKLADIFKDVQDKIGDFAATGGGEAKDIFENLGLSIDKIRELKPDEQLLAIAEGLDQVENRSEQIFYLEAIANDASRLLPLLEDGASELRKLQTEARVLGVSLSDMDVATVQQVTSQFHRLGGFVEGAANQFTLALAPAITGVTDIIGDALVETGGFQEAFETAIDVIIKGSGFVAENINSVLILLNYAKLGWLYVGKAATEAMAGAADVTADVINTILEPFVELISLIADGWGHIITKAGDFLGNDAMSSFGKSLAEFSESARDFNVSADDVIAADVAMAEAIKNTEDNIVSLTNAQPGDDLWKWWQKVKEEAQAAAKAQVDAKNKSGPSNVGNVSNISKPLSELVDEANEFGNTWASVGDTVVDAFGSMVTQLDRYAEKQKELAELEKELADKRSEYETDPVKYAAELEQIGKAEEALNARKTKSSLSAYAQMTRSAAAMYDEQSSQREALHKLELLFTAAEIAMSFTRAGASAVEGIANQAKGDPYSAFARMAAMAGIMSSLGVFGGSVSGVNVNSSEYRQENQGTGTVLGDSSAKSESIVSAYDRMIELETDQYAELRDMNNSIKALNSGIAQLAVSLVSGFGRFDGNAYGGTLGSRSDTSAFEEFALLGLWQPLKNLDPTGIIDSIVGNFSRVKKSLIDSGIQITAQTMKDIMEGGVLSAQAYFDVKTKDTSFWGLVSDSSTNTEYQAIDRAVQNEFGLIFSHIGTSALEAAQSLGFESVMVDVTNSVGNAFNNINGDFRDLGFQNSPLVERFAEQFGSQVTSIEMSLEDALANFEINIPNLSLKDLSGDEIQAELEAVFSQQADLIAETLVPGIAEFQQMGEGLYDTLVRVAQEQAVFNSVLEMTGNSIGALGAEASIEIAQNIIELAGGIEELSSAANTYFSEFFSEAEQLAYLETQLTEQFASLGQVMPSTREEFRQLVESLDLTTAEGQSAYAALLQLSPQMASYFDQLDQGTEQLSASAAEFVAKVEELTQSIRTQVDTIFEQDDAIASTQALLDVERALFNERTAIYEAQLQQQEDLKAYIAGLQFGNLSILAPTEQLSAAQSQFETATAENAQEFANTYLEAARAMYGSSDEYSQIYNSVIDQLTSLSSSDLDVPDDALIQTYEAEIELLKSQSEAAENVEALSSLFDDLTELANTDMTSFNRLIVDLAETAGIDTSNLNNSEAIEAFVDELLQAAGIDDANVDDLNTQLTDLLSLQFDPVHELVTSLSDITDISNISIEDLNTSLGDLLGIETTNVDLLNMSLNSLIDLDAVDVETLDDALTELLGIDTTNVDLLNTSLGDLLGVDAVNLDTLNLTLSDLLDIQADPIDELSDAIDDLTDAIADFANNAQEAAQIFEDSAEHIFIPVDDNGQIDFDGWAGSNDGTVEIHSANVVTAIEAQTTAQKEQNDVLVVAIAEQATALTAMKDELALVKSELKKQTVITEESSAALNASFESSRTIA